MRARPPSPLLTRVLLAAAVLTVPALARADEPQPQPAQAQPRSPSQAEPQQPAQPRSPSQAQQPAQPQSQHPAQAQAQAQQPLLEGRRPLPDYDGREPAPTPPGEALLWVPRVALYPVHLVTEYGIRAPLGFLIANAERYRVLTVIAGLVHPHPNVYVAPTFGADLGLLTLAGVYFAWNNALVPRNEFRLRVATAGPQYWAVTVADRFRFAPRSDVGVRATFTDRADWLFYGVGPDTSFANQQRFGWSRWDVGPAVRYDALAHFGFDAAAGARFDAFNAPFLTGVPGQAPNAAPPGYDNKRYGYATARAWLDTRPHGDPNRTGARIEVAGQLAADFDRESRRWASYEVEGSAFLEVIRPGRVLGVRAWTAFADPLGRDPVPFVDLVTLGGFESMRGWWVGRFRGESAAVFTLSWRYPVWYLLDGTVLVEAGNAFGPHLAGFSPSRLFGSAGIGFRTTGDREQSLDLLLAVGTTRFDTPFAIENVRLAVGLNRGF